MFEPRERLRRYETALAEIEPPFAFVDLDAMSSNARAMITQAAGKPIRIASKSVRCRALIEQALASDPGFQGLLCYTLPEALWLWGHGQRNLLVAYPATDRTALRALAAVTTEHPDTAPVLMIDSREQLEVLRAAVGAGQAPIRVCLDFDAAFWLAGGRVRLGAKRTPIHTVAQARALAEVIEASGVARLAGMMSYEGHIAGLGDIAPGNPLRSMGIRRMQSASFAELRERRAAAVAAVREVASLEFVNAGGTGDLQLVASEPAMTEATAGSGFYAPTLFDNYTSFRLQPAAMFVLPIVRRPRPGVVTALGGGYMASGAAQRDRLPTPYLPLGLRLDSQEGAGEVQTPLLGAAADSLAVGDRVYFRHTKAGELCERFNTMYLVRGEAVVDSVPTYRGEGQCFL